VSLPDVAVTLPAGPLRRVLPVAALVTFVRAPVSPDSAVAGWLERRDPFEGGTVLTAAWATCWTGPVTGDPAAGRTGGALPAAWLTGPATAGAAAAVMPAAWRARVDWLPGASALSRDWVAWRGGAWTAVPVAGAAATVVPPTVLVTMLAAAGIAVVALAGPPGFGWRLGCDPAGCPCGAGP
jgi:hypothetical protein